MIESLNGTVPTLLLHSCCAPCSSYTLEYLSRYFSITVFYFNPNISPKAEFDKRFAEQKRLIETLPSENKISLICGDYNYDEFFCTTLSISPLKNSQKINEIGFNVAEKYGVKWLPSDFKKREGYKRSIELSREYDLYRQNFCGCVFSKSQN